MQKTVLQLLLAIAALLAAGLYWTPGADPSADPAVMKRQMALAQTYLEETRSWEYSDSGELSQILEAQRAEFFKRRNVSELEQPRFYSHDGNDRSWSASAEWGRYRHAAGILNLQDSVVLHNDQTGGTLESAAMTLNVKNNTARSKVPVTITQGDSNIRADGMVADLNRERIVMSPNVESIYVQAQP